jgi:hypothetical protein
MVTVALLPFASTICSLPLPASVAVRPDLNSERA